jgi:hypothetical protein
VKRQFVLLIIALVTTSAACTPAAGDSSTTPDSPTGQELPQVTQARNDLAQRLAVPVEQIEVVEVREVTWPDTGMGCPQPGMEYLQVPQDGLLVQLSTAGVAYEYHSGGSAAPFLCETPTPVEGKITPVFGEDILTRPSQEGE